MRRMKKRIFTAAAALMMLCAAGCADRNTEKTAESVPETTAETVQRVSAYDREAVGETKSAGCVLLTPYFYGPVTLAGTSEVSAEGKNLHLEVDAVAAENDLGYREGEWIPYLTIDYDVADKDGNTVASGALMVSSSKNGPTYGSNISLPGSGSYSLRLSVHSPAENGFYLHKDERTGVSGEFWDKPITVTWPARDIEVD